MKGFWLFVAGAFLTACSGGSTPTPDVVFDTVDADTTDTFVEDSQGSDVAHEDAHEDAHADTLDVFVDVAIDGHQTDATLSDADIAQDSSPIEDLFDPTALPNAPEPIIMQAISPSSIQVALQEPAIFVGDLGPQGRLIQTQSSVFVAQSALYLEAEVPEGIIHAATVHGPNSVFGTDQGLWVLDNGFFFTSPINDLLTSSMVRSVFSDNAGLWIGQSDAVLLWEEDSLFDINVDGIEWQAPLMSYGALYDGVPTLWIADQELVMALIEEGDAIVAVTVLEGRDVSHMSSDGAGNLWMISEGTIIKRDSSGALTWLSHDEEFTGLFSSLETNDTWLRNGSGLVWWSDGVFAAVQDTSSIGTAAPVGQGALLASNVAQTILVSMDGSSPVVTTNWTDQIQPLYEAKCSTCHSPDNIASDFSTPLAWQENIDAILLRTTVDMPANDPPLDPALYALIESWKEGGFLP